MPATPTQSPARPPQRAGRRAVGRAASALAVLCAAGLLLAACTDPDTQFAPACPGLALVPYAGDLTRFNGRGIDITDLITHARITGVPAKCGTTDKNVVTATLHVEASVERGPAALGATPGPIGYFIAVMEGKTVLKEQDYSFVPTFPPNVDRTTFTGDDINLDFAVSKKKSAAAYNIYVGFRLTPAELAYNRTHARP